MHSTTKTKPVDAVKKKHHLCVSWHLWDSAKRDRTYPNISQNDYVRIKINQVNQIYLYVVFCLGWVEFYIKQMAHYK